MEGSILDKEGTFQPRRNQIYDKPGEEYFRQRKWEKRFQDVRQLDIWNVLRIVQTLVGMDGWQVVIGTGAQEGRGHKEPCRPWSKLWIDILKGLLRPPCEAFEWKKEKQLGDCSNSPVVKQVVVLTGSKEIEVERENLYFGGRIDRT